MSFDKIEVRVFGGPDQVQVGSNTKPDLVVMNIGPKGDTGPNSVTSATTSDGTGQIMLDTLAVGICNILDEVVFDTLTYTFAEGSAQALKDALDISFADISDAQTGTTDLILENLTATNLASGTASIGSALIVGDGDSVKGRYDIFGNTSHFQWYSDSALYGERSFTITTDNLTSSGSYVYKYPVGNGTIALTGNTSGEPDKLTGGTISGTTTLNSTSYTYGTGAAAAHRDALGVAGKQSKTTTSAVTSTNAVAVDIFTGLTDFTLEANATYRLTLHAIISTSSGGSFEFFFDCASTTYLGGQAQTGAGVFRSGGVLNGGYHYNTTRFSPLYSTQNLTNGHAYGEYYFRTSATAGTAKMKFAQRPAAIAGTTTVAEGATAILEKIS